MAPQSGTEDLAVAPQADTAVSLALVKREMEARPGRFEFFQTVRLMLRMFSRRAAPGTFLSPAREGVRFRVNNSLRFPPSQVESVEWRDESAVMTVNFMGLTGPMGVLPRAYSEMVLSRIRARDHAPAEFFDLFNHRMISLFYLAWEKYRSSVAYERDGQDRLSKYLMSLIGLGTGGLQDRMVVRDESLLYYTGLLAQQARSAVGLRGVLQDYFGVPVEVVQFVGVWRPIEKADQCDLGSGATFNSQLGVGAIAGDEVWDQQSRIRLRIGPLSQEEYLSFLPGGAAFEPLRELARFYCGAHLEIETQLVLRRNAVPSCKLQEPSLAGPRLGWFTWMKSGSEFGREPADTVFLLT